MGIFDFLKPKKDPMEEVYQDMMNSIFPNGEEDINSATTELVHVLNETIACKEAKTILIKAAVISRISEEFDEERLRKHLAGYCLHHFNQKQVKECTIT